MRESNPASPAGNEVNPASPAPFAAPKIGPDGFPALPSSAAGADALRVVTSGSDGRARVWDTTSGRRVFTLIGLDSAIFTAAYSPDGNRIATAGIGPVTKLWDAHTGRLAWDLDSQRDRILAAHGFGRIVRGYFYFIFKQVPPGAFRGDAAPEAVGMAIDGFSGGEDLSLHEKAGKKTGDKDE